MLTNQTHDHETDGRRLAVVLRDVLRAEQFETLADLTDALKSRCARLKVPWTNEAISDAYRMVRVSVLVSRPLRWREPSAADAERFNRQRRC